MVHGIVILLDGPHTLVVEEMWREFERKYGVSQLSRRMHYPHISLHVASGYQFGQVERVLSTIAGECKPFKVKVTGLCIFATGDPVLTLNVVRTDVLNALHARVWDAVRDLSTGILDYYSPDNWVPHITLASGDVGGGKLPRLVSALTDRNLDWEITVENITLMVDDGLKHDIRQRADIGIIR